MMVPTFRESNGTLRVYERSTIGFKAARTFLVHGSPDSLRGGHAHRACCQLLVAVSGRITVAFEGKTGAGNSTLSTPDVALLLPPMTWATQHFHDADSILMVICDQEYDESDYIRDYGQYGRIVGAFSPKS
jgi:UDP-2-acetamido-3-amino-2,3-dideoxy-glucuronate N-acetyltransferase